MRALYSAMKNTSVQTAFDGDVVLVGEEHHNKHSARLGQEILETVAPEVLAVESGPYHTPRDGAMGRIVDYSQDNNLPLVKIDKGIGKFSGLDCSRTELLNDANKFSHPIEADGDVAPAAIHNARRRVRENHGNEAHRAMYPDREREMVERLNWARRELGTPVVAGVGVFHIFALRDLLGVIEREETCSGKRIENNERQAAMS